MGFGDSSHSTSGKGPGVASLWSDSEGLTAGSSRNAAVGSWSELGSLAAVSDLHGRRDHHPAESQQSKSGKGQKGASLHETLAMAEQVPVGRHTHVTAGSEEPKQVHAKGKSADGHKAPAANAQGVRHAVPAHIAKTFPGADFSNVTVITDSPQAQHKHVQGFATIDEIHLAPGRNTDEVLRHEAAHVVQFRNGKRARAAGAKTESREENEHKAESAEPGGRIAPAALGTAEPDAVRHKEADANEHGAPKVVFNGTTFESIEGEFSQKLSSANWGKKPLFNKEQWWRFPALPIAGLYVKASALFEPQADISWKGTYKYEHKEGRYSLGGALEGQISAGISFALEGGGGINLVIQRGGIGLEAKALLQAYAKTSKQFSAWIDKEGNFGLDLIPLEVDLGAVLKATLSLVLWTDGWFWDDKWKWTFAEFVVATLAQYKTQIGVSMASTGIKPTIGPVKEGIFTWGSAPNVDKQNASSE